jgi:hypothetical protein
MIDVMKIPKLMIIGLCLSMLSILYGFTVGGAFGLAEKGMKQHLNQSGVAVLDTVYKGDVAAKDAVVAKSWEYFKRSHLHGGAIGSAGVAVILAMILLCKPLPIAGWCSVAFGSGAIIYSVFWLFAGLLAPGMGSTGAAKENLNFMAIPGAGLTLIGLTGAIILIIKDALMCRSAPS